MIESMHIENFKCFKNFDIELGKFNVLIGRNDSGKTAFLQAVALGSAVCSKGQLPLGHLREQFRLEIGQGFVWREGNPDKIEIRIRITAEGRKGDVLAVLWQKARPELFRAVRVEGDALTGVTDMNWLTKAIGRAQYIHLDPAALRKPSQVLSNDRAELGADGAGFPTYLEGLLRADREAFSSMEKAFYEMFRHYKPIDVRANGGMNSVFFRQRTNSPLSAVEVSDGAILYLAYLAIAKAPESPSILLVEEPENGVHHGSLKEIVGALRHLSDEKGVQVIATTHSPYLLDLVEPDQVRIFTKDEEGAVHATNMAGAPDVQAMKKHFQTGEIWTCLSEDRLVRSAGEKR